MSNGNSSEDQYKKLIEDMLNESRQVLDEHVVNKLVKEVENLTLSDSGEVLSIVGDPQEVIQNLINKFVGLSNEIIIKTLKPLLQQCPWIKIPDVYSKPKPITSSE